MSHHPQVTPKRNKQQSPNQPEYNQLSPSKQKTNQFLTKHSILSKHAISNLTKQQPN